MLERAIDHTIEESSQNWACELVSTVVHDNFSKVVAQHNARIAKLQNRTISKRGKVGY